MTNGFGCTLFRLCVWEGDILSIASSIEFPVVKVRSGAQNNSTPWWWAWRTEEKQFGWVTGLTLRKSFPRDPDKEGSIILGWKRDSWCSARWTTKVYGLLPKNAAHRRLHNWCLNYSRLLITLSLWSSPRRSILGNSTALPISISCESSGASHWCMSRDVMNLRRRSTSTSDIQCRRATPTWLITRGYYNTWLIY